MTHLHRGGGQSGGSKLRFCRQPVQSSCFVLQVSELLFSFLDATWIWEVQAGDIPFKHYGYALVCESFLYASLHTGVRAAPVRAIRHWLILYTCSISNFPHNHHYFIYMSFKCWIILHVMVCIYRTSPLYAAKKAPLYFLTQVSAPTPPYTSLQGHVWSFPGYIPRGMTEIMPCIYPDRVDWHLVAIQNECSNCNKIEHSLTGSVELSSRRVIHW